MAVTIRMLLPKHTIFRNFLSSDDLNQLLNFVLARPEGFEPATVYVGGSQEISHQQRHAAKLQGGLGPHKKAFLNRVNEAVENVFSGAGMKARPVLKFETEVAAHGDGGRFGRHIDTLTGRSRDDQTTGGSRTVSAVYYFYNEPKQFSGGELRLFAFGGSDGANAHVDIVPERNSLVVFPSFASHEVLLVSCPSKRFEDQRFSVNCWLHCSSN